MPEAIFRYVKHHELDEYITAGWVAHDSLVGTSHGQWSTLCEWPEIWRPVIGGEGLYEISSHGRIRSLDRVLHKPLARCGYPRRINGRLLKLQKMQTGYLVVSLRYIGGPQHRPYFVSHLVADAFIGPRPIKAQVCHNDGDRMNNCSFNLRYATPAENAKDKAKHGTAYRGDRHHYAKLTSNQVIEIKQMLTITSQQNIANRFGVSLGTIQSIAAGRNWGWLHTGQIDTSLMPMEVPFR